MPRHTDWPSFQLAVATLHASDPGKTRFCVRWRADKGALSLRVTDDLETHEFIARSAALLNRFEHMMRVYMHGAANVKRTAPAAASTPTSAAAPTSNRRKGKRGGGKGR